jgi:hypothetical protein
VVQAFVCEHVFILSLCSNPLKDFLLPEPISAPQASGSARKPGFAADYADQKGQVRHFG